GGARSVFADAGQRNSAHVASSCAFVAQARSLRRYASVRSGSRDGQAVIMAGDLARRIVFKALGGLQGGEIVLRYPDGRGRRFGDGLGPRVIVDLHRPDDFWRKLALRTRVGFGESYVDGDWDAD